MIFLSQSRQVNERFDDVISSLQMNSLFSWSPLFFHDECKTSFSTSGNNWVIDLPKPITWESAFWRNKQCLPGSFAKSPTTGNENYTSVTRKKWKRKRKMTNGSWTCSRILAPQSVNHPTSFLPPRAGLTPPWLMGRKAWGKDLCCFSPLVSHHWLS